MGLYWLCFIAILLWISRSHALLDPSIPDKKNKCICFCQEEYILTFCSVFNRFPFLSFPFRFEELLKNGLSDTENPRELREGSWRKRKAQSLGESKVGNSL